MNPGENAEWKLEDFEKVDCKRFRQPPLDYSVIEDEIAEAIVNAWKHDISPEAIIKELSCNSKFLSRLEVQINQNLLFQRAASLAKLDKSRNSRFSAYDAEKEALLSQTESEHAKRLEAARQAAIDAQKMLEEKKGYFSASQASLEKSRKRIDEMRSRIGGEDGYQRLLAIRAALAGDESSIKKRKGLIWRNRRQNEQHKEQENLYGDQLLEFQAEGLYSTGTMGENKAGTGRFRQTYIRSMDYIRNASRTIWKVLNKKIF